MNLIVKRALKWVIAPPIFSTPSSHPIRVLVYGDSNTWGWVPTESGFPTTRFPLSQRFSGVMQRELGSGFEVIENGLNNRTTNLDYPTPIGIVSGEAFNGAKTLPGLLAAHAPVDLVVILLGTNDLKAPPQIGEMPHPYIAEHFSGAQVESKGFGEAYHKVAKAAGVPFLDAMEAIGVTAGWDGIHISASQHQMLGKALATKIKNIFKSNRGSVCLFLENRTARSKD